MIAAKAMGARNAGAAKKKKKVEETVDETPVDVYNRELDPSNYSGFLRQYIVCSLRTLELVQSDGFNGFVIGCICLAGVLVGIQTYPEFEADPTLDTIDLFILGVFLTESVLKIVAEGAAPWRYFVGPEWRWNNFDFVIVVLCLPIWGDAFGGGNVALLRMLRLMRVMKLVKKIPQLHMIVMGLIGGIKSIGYIILLLLLVFYLYAVAGMYAFRNNDPWHFGNLFTAMNTLFRLATLEDWTDVMYINYFGCDEFHAGLYTKDPKDAQHNRYCNVTDVYGLDESLKGSIKNQMKALSAVYFVTFIVISALVMLSLFVGAITMSMTESMQQMKEANDEAERKRMLEKAKKRTEKPESFNMKSSRKILSKQEERDRQKMRKVLSKVWAEALDKENTNPEQTEQHTLSFYYTKIAGVCQSIVEHPRFSSFVTYVILLAGIVVGLQTDENVMAEIGPTLQVVDTIILVVFTTEVALKMIAECFTPWYYFKSGWNSFDFVIVVGSFLPGSGSLLTVLRLLRLLRVLKLVKSLPQLQVIVSALIKGIGSIGYIGIIMVLVYYVFAILGIILFRDNDPWHFGSLHFAMLTLFRCSTLEDWTDVMYINMYGCNQYGYEDYKEQGYTCIDTPKGVLAAAYFLVFTVIGALVLITLFIGVVTTSMEEATQEMEKENELKERIKDLQIERGLDEETVLLYVEVFQLLDLDGSGAVEAEELAIGLSSVGLYPSTEEINRMMDEVAADEGQIDVALFVAFMANAKTKEVARRSSLTPADLLTDVQKLQEMYHPDDIQEMSPVIYETETEQDITTQTHCAVSPRNSLYIVEDLDDMQVQAISPSLSKKRSSGKIVPTS